MNEISSRALPTSNDLGVYFFHQTNIYELDYYFDDSALEMKFKSWSKMPQTLSVNRISGPIVMYIPSELTDCYDTEQTSGEGKQNVIKRVFI